MSSAFASTRLLVCGRWSTVVSTDRFAVAEQWIAQHVLLPRVQRVGFDTESQPIFRRPNELALLQFSVQPPAPADAQVLLLSIHNWGPESAKWLPYIPSLNTVLQSPFIFKFAIDTRNDEREMNKIGLSTAGFVDLQTHPRAAVLVEAKKRPGTALLASTFLGLVLPKDESVTRSSWAAFPLSAKQLQYATQDVVLALALAEHLHAPQNAADDSFLSSASAAGAL